MTVKELAPTRLRMTYEEFRHWASEDTHADWIDGEVFEHMPPNDIHQRIVGYLFELLSMFLRLAGGGIVRVAPFEMRFATAAFEPDILVVKPESMRRHSDDRLEGPADLVIEVVSPSSVAHDRDTKFRAYEAARVPEYWVIDPRHNRADFFRLDEHGMYRLFATDDDERASSHLLKGFWLKPAWLWMEEPPSPLEAVAEMAGVSGDAVAQLQSALRIGLQGA